MTDGPVVLLEGASDVAAVRAVADVLGVDDEHVRYVDLGGVTNVRRRLEILRVDEPDTDVVGMCDAGEVEMGLRSTFYTFQGQPAWRDRELPDQLRRFCGTTSGRKEILARELASALTPESVPAPLRLLVERLR